MKKAIWMAVVLAGMTVAAQGQEARLVTVSAPQVKDNLFAGTEKFANGASNVTELNMDPNMLAMVNTGNAELAKKMDFVVIHSYEYDKPGMYNSDEVEVFRKKLADGSWSCFLHVTGAKTGEKTDMCVRANGDTNELVLVAAEPRELTFIHIKGRVSLADLERMNSMTRMSANMARHGMGVGSTMSFTPFVTGSQLQDAARAAADATRSAERARSTLRTYGGSAPTPATPPTPPAAAQPASPAR